MTDTSIERAPATAPTTAPTTVTIDPVVDERWADLAAHHGGDVFHAPAWLRVLQRTYDLPIRANVVVDAAGTAEAGWVYSPVTDMMDRRVVSLPFSDFCDPLVQTRAEWAAVSDGVITPGSRVQLKSLHCPVPLDDPRLETVGRARWHAVDLARDVDEMWEAISPSARRSIRKARKEGVHLRVGESREDMRAFFDMHLRVRKYKYGLLAQPWTFFEAIWDELLAAGTGAVVLAYRGSDLLGGVVFLEWNGTLYYKFNASVAEQQGLRPNDLVIWHAIELGAERGLDRLDFGLSDWDQEGLLRFKRKYATEEKTIHTLRSQPLDGPSDQETAYRRLLPELTALFTDPGVPDAVTEAAGGLLYRYFT